MLFFKKRANFMGKLLHNDKQRNYEDTFEKRKRSFIYLFIYYLFIVDSFTIEDIHTKKKKKD